MFMGWNSNGFGGAATQDALTRADLCQDMNFQQMENGVRGVQQGICDGFYAQNTNMLNGFYGLQGTLCSGFSGLTNQANQNTAEIVQALNNNNITGMQDMFAITSKLNEMEANRQSCCCET
jgi:hypothetical protein